MKDITTIIFNSLQAVLVKISAFLPSFIGGLVLLLIGWILSKGIKRLIITILSRPSIKSKLDSVIEVISPGNAQGIDLADIIGKVVYWFVFLIFLLSATEAMGLQMLSQQISALIQYLPKLTTAIIILLLGIYAASGVKEVIGSAAKAVGIKPWRVLSSLSFYLMVIFIGITALNQASIDTQIITSNLTVIIAGLSLAFAIAYGSAARPFLAGILGASYTKAHFKVGQVVEIEGEKGTITAIDNISVVLESESGKIVFPSQKLLSDKVKILIDAEE